jgi:branched-chain amino acid transport system ATP-binding protein
MLAVEHLTIRYGSAMAVCDFTLKVHAGEIVTLLGANGAGKSSTLLAIMGVVRPESGDVRFEERSLIGHAPDQIGRMGISLVPEGRHVFARLTVDENLRLGGSGRRGRSAREADREAVYQRFPVLKERRGQRAGMLSGGEQQQLAIGRALVGRPRLLLLDEPSLGLAPLVVDEVFRTLRELHEAGMTILLVEQYAHRALELADRVYLLSNGRLTYETTADAMLASGALEDAYLGGTGGNAK